jgi:hypothetical protein
MNLKNMYVCIKLLNIFSSCYKETSHTAGDVTVIVGMHTDLCVSVYAHLFIALSVSCVCFLKANKICHFSQYYIFLIDLNFGIISDTAPYTIYVGNKSLHQDPKWFCNTVFLGSCNGDYKEQYLLGYNTM